MNETASASNTAIKGLSSPKAEPDLEGMLKSLESRLREANRPAPWYSPIYWADVALGKLGYEREVKSHLTIEDLKVHLQTRDPHTYLKIWGALQERRLPIEETTRAHYYELYRKAVAASEAEALQDPLTGLEKRLGLEREVKHLTAQYAPYLLGRSVNRARRDGRQENERTRKRPTELPPLSVLFIDLDNLKALNAGDYARGDEAIIYVGKVIRQLTRQSDITSRWGGDEFAILSPSTSRKNAKKLAKKIQEHIDAKSSEDLGFHINVSIGTATYLEDARDPEKFLYAAQVASKMAKREGKGRVVQFNTQVEAAYRKNAAAGELAPYKFLPSPTAWYEAA